MKKNCLVAAIIFSFLFLALGCENIYAEYSGNIEHVSAYYYIGETIPDSEDKLQKTELTYTKLNITPKESLKAAGISFDIKNKENSQAQMLLKVYVTKAHPEDNEADVQLSETSITFNGTTKKIEITFEDQYDFSVSVLDKTIDTDMVTIEFLNTDNSKNTSYAFSLNNIKLLVAE